MHDYLLFWEMAESSAAAIRDKYTTHVACRIKLLSNVSDSCSLLYCWRTTQTTASSSRRNEIVMFLCNLQCVCVENRKALTSAICIRNENMYEFFHFRFGSLIPRLSFLYCAYINAAHGWQIYSRIVTQCSIAEPVTFWKFSSSIQVIHCTLA